MRLLQEPINLLHASFSWWIHTSGSTDTTGYKRAAKGRDSRRRNKMERPFEIRNTGASGKKTSQTLDLTSASYTALSGVPAVYRCFCGRTARARLNPWTQSGPPSELQPDSSEVTTSLFYCLSKWPWAFLVCCLSPVALKTPVVHTRYERISQHASGQYNILMNSMANQFQRVPVTAKYWMIILTWDHTGHQQHDGFTASNCPWVSPLQLFRASQDAIPVRIRTQLQSVLTFMQIQWQTHFLRVTKESDLLAILGIDLTVFSRWLRHMATE